MFDNFTITQTIENDQTGEVIQQLVTLNNK
jgi:hypothetical protein